MGNNCSINGRGSNIIGQHLFLGSSITSFSSNIGWGGSTSSLNVELVNDFGCPYANSYSLNNFYLTDNHYYECVGDSCYIDENLNPYDSSISKEKIVPGKIYHVIRSNEILSKYWTLGDPGFFGDYTHITPLGRYDPNNWYSYNIINSPVYFRYGYFTFGGFVAGWDKTIRAGSESYSVNIISPDTVLSNSKIILRDYKGSVFGKYRTSNYGGPVNYAGNGLQYTGSIKEGLLTNVFNVYGFLESYGFGGSALNDNGIPITYILNALSVLTSAVNVDSLGNKQAFSPLGRIVASTTLTNAPSPTTTKFNDYGFGLIDPTLDTDGTTRSQFILDLSEIPRPPLDIRFDNVDVISIADFIRMVCDKTGRDFYTTMIRKNGYDVIKIKTINRTVNVYSNYIESVVENMTNSGLNTTTASFGKQSNDCTPKVMYIGGNQQRLFQAKTRKLAYSQTSYVFHPLLNKFVDFSRFAGSDSSLKTPNFLSTKNTNINSSILGDFTADLWNINEQIRQDLYGDAFYESDPNFSDKVVGGDLIPIVGNYFQTVNYGEFYPRTRIAFPTKEEKEASEDSQNSEDSEEGTTNPLVAASNYSRNRYIPIHNSAICPFFGYKYNEKLSSSSDPNNNTFRFVRPVLHDHWTNQLVVLLSLNELPTLSLGSLPSIYANPDIDLNLSGKDTTQLNDQANIEIDEQAADVALPNEDPEKTPSKRAKIPTKIFPANQIFKITETEIRAAMEDFDSYFAYCLKKMPSEKPDLFVMLVALYKALNKLTTANMPVGLSALPNPTTGLNIDYNINTSNVANDVGQKGNTPKRQPIKDLDLSFTMHHEFMLDLRILVEFVASIGQEFYGKKYMVRIPEILSYKDSQFAGNNGQFAVPSFAGDFYVYQGSGKIFYDKELCEGAWEEFGNMIDDCIVIGGPSYYKLIDENNLIKPILGYNASYQYDDAARIWCENSDTVKKKQLKILDRQEVLTTDLTERQKVREYKQAFMNTIGSSIDCERRIIPSLDLSSLTSDYILINTNDNREDAFRRTSVFTRSEESEEDENKDKTPKEKDDTTTKASSYRAPSLKLYLSTSCSEILYLDPYNLLGARVVIDSPGISSLGSSYAYTQDPNLTVISTAATEDMAVLFKTGQLTPELKRLLSTHIIPITDGGFLISDGDTSDQSSLHATIKPKMAQPLFAAVPLKSNNYCYGPWTNYPSLVDSQIIFPNIVNPTNNYEQLISDIKVEKKDEFVPWSVGGSSYLDLLVINTMNAELSYQNVLENGRVTANGLPIFGMSGGFRIGFTDNAVHNAIYPTYYEVLCFAVQNQLISSYVGLVLSGISINVGSNDVVTNYSFSTYSPKLGLYSKENSDRIKSIATNRISFYRQIFDAENRIQQKLNQELTRITKEISKNRSGTDLSKFRSKIYGTSPSQIFIGKSTLYIPSGELQCGDPGFPKVTGIERYNSYAGLYMSKEIQSELVKEYSSKSFMSMDGLFSPISFYPTYKNTTYSLSSRCVTEELKKQSVICPKCGGTGTYIADNNKEYACSMCSKSKLVFEDQIADNAEDTDLPVINAVTLNPIVVPYGEFKNVNTQPSNNGERCRHSISIVGRSEDVPIESKTLEIQNSLFDLSDPKTGKIAISPDWAGPIDSETMIKIPISGAVNKDYYEYDLIHKFNTNQNILLNQRFFGLRGPIMMHGWGYDTEGYPVPNMADEPLEFDRDGRPKRFFLTPSGTNDLTKDGAFLPTSGLLLGDVIGKGYSKQNGEWQKTKTRFFHVNWAERPDLWPVGPIDVRWDESRKVWSASGGGCTEEQFPPFIVSDQKDAKTLTSFINTSKKNKNNNCPYKMVYVILEEDMILSENMYETHPTRGFLDDLEYSLPVLTIPLRRLIYIKDRCKYTAPRGSKLLCRYDTYSGFYEPITKPNFIVFGNIFNNNNAVIKLTFIQGVTKSENAPTKSIVFDNSRFNFQNTANSKGMFLFENGKWILIGIN